MNMCIFRGLVHAAVGVALLALVGCERGCLARRAADVQDAAAFTLDRVDCPDGLARCNGGRLERSKLATVDPRVPAGCPWEPAGECAGGCVENVEVPEEHARQLCREGDGGIVPNAGRPPETCPSTDGPRWACHASRVVDCERGIAVATCLRGCAMQELDEDVQGADATVILCAR